MPDEDALRLVRLPLRPLVLGPIRLGLGLVALTATLVFGGGRPAVALLAFVVGAGGSAMLLMADPRGSRSRPRDPEPLPAHATFDSSWETARAGVFPSTAGVTALAGVALAFDPTLAAILAGVLGGMAVATGLAWLQALAWERVAGGQLFAERGGARLFVDVPRGDVAGGTPQARGRGSIT